MHLLFVRLWLQLRSLVRHDDRREEELGVGEQQVARAEREDGLRAGGRQARATRGRARAPEEPAAAPTRSLLQRAHYVFATSHLLVLHIGKPICIEQNIKYQTLEAKTQGMNKYPYFAGEKLLKISLEISVKDSTLPLQVRRFNFARH